MQINTSSSNSDAINYLTSTLRQHLTNGESVLWLVPGGSAIKVAVAVSQNIKELDLSKLTVSLTDERYGSLGHKDENYTQLKEAGFDLPGAFFHRILTGSAMLETAVTYADFLRQTLDLIDFKIGLFGMGADGHTAGIKPGSSALDSSGLVSSFKGDDFARITITPHMIEKLDEAILYAFGQEKFHQIDQLTNDSLSITSQPAQSLKKAKKLTIFTDYKEK